jgi:hypothetical protein
MVIDTNEEGKVRCRPFGDEAPELEVIYQDTDLIDNYGWFHVSCRFLGGQKLIGNLYNRKIDESYQYDASGSQLTFPAGKYKIRVGYSFSKK